MLVLGNTHFVLSRRDFLLSTSALAIVASSPAEAWIHGGSQKTGLSVINAGSSGLAFANLAKSVQFQSSTSNWPSLLTSNGYPNGTVTFSNNGTQGDPYYYGHYTMYWLGTGGFQLQYPAIIYAGGGSVAGVGTSTGTQPNAIAIGASTSQPHLGDASPNGPVEFAFGALITAVGTSGDGLIQFTTASLNSGSGYSTGLNMKFNNLTYSGGAFPTGPNVDGSWTITNVSATQFKLQGSSGLTAGNVTLNTSGTPGVNSECIQSISGGINYAWPRTTYGTAGSPAVQWDGWVWCKTKDLTAVQAGQLAAPDYVSIFKSLNPRFIRFMDYSGVQSDRSSSYTYRVPSNNATWFGAFGAVSYINPNYYVGAITNGGSDAYTCSNPTASGGGAYAEGEVVIGQISGVSTTLIPTLNVNSRGAKPIIDSSCAQKSLFLSGTANPSLASQGTIISMLFTGGGLASPRTVTYTIAAGDTSLGTLANNMAAAIGTGSGGDATLLAANITCQNADVGGANRTFYYCPNINSSGAAALGNGLTISITDNSSGASGINYNVGYLNTGALGNSNYYGFTYSNALGGWVMTSGGMHAGLPLEMYADLCIRANVGCWINVGVMWSDDRILNTAKLLGQLGVKEVMFELSNETWNVGLAEWRPCRNFGTAIVNCNIGNGRPESSWAGLRTIQIATQAAAGWAAAGRSRSQLFIDIAYQFVDMNATATTNTATYKFNGNLLNAATGNPVLSAFGGYGCTAISTDYSSAPNRPIDFADCVGGAPYWEGGQFNNDLQNGSLITSGVTLSNYNGLLLAAYNYAYGTPTQQNAALDFLYTGGTSGTGDLYNGQINGSFAGGGAYSLSQMLTGSGSTNYQGYCGVGSAVATYDATRISNGRPILGIACYEGGWFMTPRNGGDVTTITGNLNTLSYTNGYSSGLPGAAAGPSGAGDTSAIAAANILTLLNAWKVTQRAQDLVKRYLTECTAAGVTGGARMSLPCWYGFQGDTSSTGSYFSLYLGEPTPTAYAATTAVNAFQAFDN